MSYSNSSDYLEEKTREEIKKAVSFFIKGGWTSKDEICKQIAMDFGVSHTAVYDIMRKSKKLSK